MSGSNHLETLHSDLGDPGPSRRFPSPLGDWNHPSSLRSFSTLTPSMPFLHQCELSAFTLLLLKCGNSLPPRVSCLRRLCQSLGATEGFSCRITGFLPSTPGFASRLAALFCLDPFHEQTVSLCRTHPSPYLTPRDKGRRGSVGAQSSPSIPKHSQNVSFKQAVTFLMKFRGNTVNKNFLYLSINVGYNPFLTYFIFQNSFRM